MSFNELERENANLRAAISDANQGLKGLAEKVVCCAHLIGFAADEPVEVIREKVTFELHRRDELALAWMQRAQRAENLAEAKTKHINELTAELVSLRGDLAKALQPHRAE